MQAPPYKGSVVHHHDHCAVRCPYCGPDSSAWAIGEVVVAGVVAAGVLAWWLIHKPVAALIILASVGLLVWIVIA
jgi:hypothetical protein